MSELMRAQHSRTNSSNEPSQYAFQNWDGKRIELFADKSKIYRSLVTMAKNDNAFDTTLEKKAVSFLAQIRPTFGEESDRFILDLTPSIDGSLNNFVTSIVVLLSSANQAVIAATMKMLDHLHINSTSQIHLKLVHAALIPRLLSSLNPLSLSFVDGAELHTLLISVISLSVWFATQAGLVSLKINDRHEQQTVHTTVLEHVLVPSEDYIRHLCTNRTLIVDRSLSDDLMFFLSQIILICPHFHPTLTFVVGLPVFFTIPSVLSIFEDNLAIWRLFFELSRAEKEWSTNDGKPSRTGQFVLRSLRTEGFDDVLQQRLQSDRTGYKGEDLVSYSIRMNNLLGMNIQQHA
ncbi:hypothetical protein BLNAU_19320 [Blattamonas nauphoetae]|uniref:Uncharacterized protein n=1 Tax=Blattamonas nauphoetae TaxID=2049346 RepID=A0ABQ9X1W7_9EUKA|nr:hypothetical protein BLNAU_19320 [Blattamonas nauphoetae]